MSKLYKCIKNKEYYKEKFESWTAQEKAFGDRRFIWELTKPDSMTEKISLFKDGNTLIVYGDYGQYCFSNMTWDGTVYNLDYDNIDYQFSKLDNDSKERLYIFTAEQAKLDIIEWVKSVLRNNNTISETDINHLIDFLNNNDFDYVDNFISKHETFVEIEDFVTFVYELFKNVENEEKAEYIDFLRRNTSIIEDFDVDVYSCDLWNAGMVIHQRYYVAMYALEICSKKLKEKNNIKDNHRTLKGETDD